MDTDGELGIDPVEVDQIRRIMAELDGADLELLEPPAGVWEGIAASVASMAARQPPPTASRPAQMVVEYAIDGHDLLIEVGADWARFADENWAPELAVPATDRTLWSYFGQGPITDLWQLAVQRVRAEQRDVRVPFRCDAPHVRRWFEMTITPGPHGRVGFRSALVFEEPRVPVDVLDPSVARDEAMEPLALCSWCGRGRHGTSWLDVEEVLRAGRLLERAAMPPVSYGICEACRQEMSAELFVAEAAGQTSA